MRPSGLIVPVTDFGLEQLPSQQLTLGDDIPYVVALNLGHNGKEPRLLQMDANGNLLVTSPAGQPAAENIAQWGGGVVGAAVATGDGASQNVISPKVFAILGLHNAASIDRAKSASAANQAAASGLGVAQVAPPGNWSVNSNPAVGAQATATRAAGGAGVRHVATGWEIVVSSQVAIAAGALVVSLRDGISGAGAILRQWTIQLAAAIIPPFAIVCSGRSIFGTAATAMTLETSAAFASLGVSVDLDGFDAA